MTRRMHLVAAAGAALAAVAVGGAAPAAAQRPGEGSVLPRATSTAPPTRPTEAVPPAPAPRPLREAAARWTWPLRPVPVVRRPFVRPVGDFGAGHRGLDLAADVGQDVLAVERGVVTHVGVVAGRPTVTVTHRDGLRSTYEPVEAAVSTGAAVAAGDVLGRLTATGSHCGADPCLHLGAVTGRAYLDPEPLLRRMRVILLPRGP